MKALPALLSLCSCFSLGTTAAVRVGLDARHDGTIEFSKVQSLTISQPQSQLFTVGSNTTFSVTAAGPGPFSYQWKFNGANLPGATSPILTLVNPQANAEGLYTVRVSDQSGSVESAPAELSLYVPLTITTFTGQSGSGNADGPLATAQFNGPYAVATGSDGTLYIAQSNHTIRKITADGIVSTLAGQADVPGRSNGTGTNALLNFPSGIAVDNSGTVFVSDTDNNMIRKISLKGVVSYWAGSLSGFGSNDGTGTAAAFWKPRGIALDNSGNLYVADSGNSTIRKINPNGDVITIAGLARTKGTNDGPGTAARFDTPWGIAVDATGNVYVADWENWTVRKIDPGPLHEVSTIAGSPIAPAGTPGRFYATGLALDAIGNLYAADIGHDTVRKITPRGLVSTLAGNEGSGYMDGIGVNVVFNDPTGITLNTKGNFFVTDRNNNAIRKGTFTPPANEAAPTQIAAVGILGSTLIFSASQASGNPPLGYQWQVDHTTIAGATNATFTLSQAQTTNQGDYSLVIRTATGSVTNPVASLSLIVPPAITMPPQRQTVTQGDPPVSFHVAAAGTPPLSYRWILPPGWLGQDSPALNQPTLDLSLGRGDFAAQFWQAGTYSVVVSNSAGSVTNSDAVLDVILPPGYVSAWGVNDEKQTYVPAGLSNVVLIGAGHATCRALDALGTLNGWGYGRFNITDVMAFGGKRLALRKDGTFVTNLFYETIRLPAGLTNIVAIHDDPELVLRQDGTVTAWDPDTGVVLNTPANLTNVVAIAGGDGNQGLGSDFYLALKSDGTVVSWGANDYGQSMVPSGLSNVVAITGGQSYAFALKSDGTLTGWGCCPDARNLVVPPGVDGNVVAVSAGFDHTIALLTTGEVKVWGDVGHADDPQMRVLPGLSNIIAVAAGASHNVVLKGTGAPVITVQPFSRTIKPGGDVSFTAMAAGMPPLNFQWQFNGNDLDGKTSRTLTLSNVQYSNDGPYTVVISNSIGSSKSSKAVLTVLAPPEITSPPADFLTGNGGHAQFTVGAVGYPVLTYQWQLNGTNLPGETNPTLMLSNVTEAQRGAYTVVISNIIGTVKSTAATLTVTGIAVTPSNINSTWTAANSPYVVESNITTANLAIQPGVTVLFDGPYSLTVTGLLQAIGTATDPIKFTGGPASNLWQGIRFVSASSNSVMSYCTVQGARSTAIRFTNTAMSIDHCVIDSNSGVGGGGIYTDSSLILRECNIRNNTALYGKRDDVYYVRGGGIYISDGDVTLESCVLSNNTAVMSFIGNVTETSAGGAIDCEAGNLSLNNCLVTSNRVAGAGATATGVGGGVYMGNSTSSFSASLCTFHGNSAADGFGGALALSAGTLRNCVFSGNRAGQGGALFVSGSSRILATNCLLSANNARQGGAAYCISGNRAGVFENCTLARNSSDALYGFTGFIHNSILFFNGSEIVTGSIADPIVTYSDVQGGYTNAPSATNLDIDPKFSDEHSYLLSNDSPVIDMGDPGPQFEDLAFPPAIPVNKLNDMGAYGGPGASFWPYFRTNVPVVVVDGQAAEPFQVFTNKSPTIVTFTNGYPKGSFEYTLDGSNPLDAQTLATVPLVLTNGAVIRVIAYPADNSEYAIAAPVTVLPAYKLTASAGGGRVYPESGNYLSNTLAVLSATNSAGWTFIGWSGDASGTNNPLSVLMNGVKNVNAIFGTPVNVSVLGHGTVRQQPDIDLYPYGSTLRLSAIPDSTFSFLLWGGAGDNNTNSPLDFVITNASPRITARFQGGLPGTNSTLSLVVNGQGTASKAPNLNIYTNGSLVSLSANSAAGYRFIGWSGDASGTSNPLTVTLDRSKTVIANFESILQPAREPPAVSITYPVAGAVLTSPTNLIIQASASQKAGRVVQVAFVADANLLGIKTDAPFNYKWTNAPVGRHVLLAQATDEAGLSVFSAPVTVTVNSPPPGPPQFTLSQEAYSVFGYEGSVTITVLKSSNSLAGAVNYSTQPSSAVPVINGVGNYYTTAGQLRFGADESSKTVKAMIVNNTFYQGNVSFDFVLSPAGDGSILGAPSSAKITITDVNSSAKSNSFLRRAFPDYLEPFDGVLRVTLLPENIGGQWRLAWEPAWHNSGFVIKGLSTGMNYPIEFKPVTGFLQPQPITNFITSGLNSVTNQYETNYLGQVTFGSLAVAIQPLAAHGQWRLQGESTEWHDTDYILSNLIVGGYIVEFRKVENWVTPSPLVVYVTPNQVGSNATTYLPAQDLRGTPPTPLLQDDATVPHGDQPPYVYTGQLHSDVGYGSGIVVKPRVVLTAAHVVFNDATLSYVPVQSIGWFFQRYKGYYEPAPKNPRGVYVLSGYAEAREKDNSPGEESLTSQNLDVAALYFAEDAGRGGYSGYLVSDSNGKQWLQEPGSKTLVGYPVESVDADLTGKMFATTPSPSVRFSLESPSVFSTTDIIGYPGNSGGPLCVQYSDGTYYPAGVYLGSSAQKTIVRAIDSTVAELINSADVTANTGKNNLSGGTLQLTSGLSGSPLATGFLEVVLGPREAINAGAGWRSIQSTGDYFTDSTARPWLAGSSIITFHPVTGFLTPADLVMQVIPNLTNVFNVDYISLRPKAAGAPVLSNGKLHFSYLAPAGQRYAIERSADLRVWAALQTNSVSGGVLDFVDSISVRAKSGFYRARWVP